MTTIATKYPFIGSIETKQGGRNENQDNAGFVDTPLGLLLVVCDGMGGGPGGRTASLMAVDTVLTILSDVSVHTPREAALKFAIGKANDIIYAKAKEQSELRGMGTTIAAILINEDSAIIAHAGDTRIYQLRKGSIVFRSLDHSYVANLIKQKKISEEEARNHPQVNIVTRALGIRPSIELALDEVVFNRGDRFVVCTDGIWGVMSQRDLVKGFSRVMGISELTTLITDEIDEIGKRAGGGHDNLTLAIIDTPFDSEKKQSRKNKKECATNSKIKRNKFHIWMKPIVLISCLMNIIMGFVFFYDFRHKNTKIQNGKHFPTKDQLAITIDEDEAIIETKDSVSSVPNFTKEYVNLPYAEEVVNPFQDTTIKKIEKNKEFISHINYIVRNLDSLKEIKGKDRNNAQKSKQKFLKEIIEPNVIRLEDKVIEEKKYKIKSILKMLNDNKTIQSSKNGLTTAESSKHIEVIKAKVRGLQE